MFPEKSVPPLTEKFLGWIVIGAGVMVAIESIVTLAPVIVSVTGSVSVEGLAKLYVCEPVTSKPESSAETTPAELAEPSPQWMEAANWPGKACGLASVKLATTRL